jgi:cytochrome c nitrite reductase small subunit
MNWRGIEALVLGTAIGLAAGVGGYTFVYARGASYLTNDPAACVNCHVMREYYDGWITSSHRAVAVCNDCHTPSGVVRKYATKAANGFRHSLAFTTGRFPESLRITPQNREITENACRECHQDIVQAIEAPHQLGEKLLCVRCHSTVGHL